MEEKMNGLKYMKCKERKGEKRKEILNVVKW